MSRLDRDIDAAYQAALGKLKSADAARLKREQREFIARRNREFGQPDYRFKRELEQRLAKLRAAGS